MDVGVGGHPPFIPAVVWPQIRVAVPAAWLSQLRASHIPAWSLTQPHPPWDAGRLYCLGIGKWPGHSGCAQGSVSSGRNGGMCVQGHCVSGSLEPAPSGSRSPPSSRGSLWWAETAHAAWCVNTPRLTASSWYSARSTCWHTCESEGQGTGPQELGIILLRAG